MQAVEVMSHVREVEDKRRGKLFDLCRGVQSTVSRAKDDTFLADQLQKRGLDRADEESLDLSTSLRDTKCPIVFAGKSKFKGRSRQMMS